MAASHSAGYSVANDRATTRLAAVALALAVLLAGLLCTFPELDFDLWWHLRTGQLIVDTGQVPRTDPFSYTAAGRPWVTHEWLAEVIFHGVDRLGGIDALILVKALIAAAALTLSASAGLAGAPRARLPAAALGVLLAAPLLAPRAFVRPHMLSALALGATLLCLRWGARSGRGVWRWALLPLFLVWANLHSGFVLGLGLVALAWIGEAVESRRAAVRSRIGWFAGLVAVTMINPHTYRAFLYPFQLVGRAEVRETIVELRPIFHPAYAGAFFLKALAVTAVVGIALVWTQRRRTQWSLLLPGAFFAILALRTLRGVSEFAVLVPALVAAHGDVLAGRRLRARTTACLVMILASLGGTLAIGHGVPMGADPPRRVGLGADRTNLPEAAVRFLREAAPPGHVFHVLAFGGWFIHELWPQRRVYIDGRLDVFPDGFIAAYRDLMQKGEGWQAAVDRYAITLAVVDYAAAPALDRGLRAMLRADPGWVVVCFSDNLLVYARRVPENAGLIAAYGCPFDPSLRTPVSLAEWLRGATTADVTQASAAVQRMLPMTAGARAPITVLTGLLGNLAERALQEGRSGEAMRQLERAVTVDPAYMMGHMRLGILSAKAGDLAAARRHFAAARRLDPANPALAQNLQTLQRLEAGSDSGRAGAR